MLIAEASSDNSLFTYIAIGGGGVAVLAILLAFIPKASVKIPAAVASGLASLAAGVGLGVLFMTTQGYRVQKFNDEPTASSPENEKAKAGMMPPGGGGGPMAARGGGGGGGMGRGGGGGGMGRGGGGGGRGPSSKTQLATLVTKLDQLTGKPLVVHLTPEMKAKVQEQLKGLIDAEEIKDEDAQKRLDALLEILQSEKETMEAAGYRWPGQGGGPPGGPADAPNPFRTPETGKKLKELQERLADKKG
jgi:hypothetical protein